MGQDEEVPVLIRQLVGVPLLPEVDECSKGRLNNLPSSFGHGSGIEEEN